MEKRLEVTLSREEIEVILKKAVLEMAGGEFTDLDSAIIKYTANQGQIRYSQTMYLKDIEQITVKVK